LCWTFLVGSYGFLLLVTQLCGVRGDCCHRYW